MPNQLAHFAINANDVARAREFYHNVFGWSYQAYGPPGFYQILTEPVRGALQQRREIVPGAVMQGFECTISVEDIRATEAAILASGGSIVMPVCTLTGVGQLLFFEDTEGNIAGAMRYDRRAD